MNTDFKLRDEILFGQYDADRYKHGGISRFACLDYETLETLIELDFIDEDECFNNSPTTKEFLEFMRQYRTFTAHGYAASPNRSDYRITIEGIVSNETFEDRESMLAFVDLCRMADEFSMDPPYAWWD